MPRPPVPLSGRRLQQGTDHDSCGVCSGGWSGVHGSSARPLVGWQRRLAEGARDRSGWAGCGWGMGPCLSASQGGRCWECRLLVSPGGKGSGGGGLARRVGGHCGGAACSTRLMGAVVTALRESSLRPDPGLKLTGKISFCFISCDVLCRLALSRQNVASAPML